MGRAETEGGFSRGRAVNGRRGKNLKKESCERRHGWFWLGFRDILRGER